MSLQHPSFERFVRKWVSETERAVPDVSSEAGLERLLRAQRDLGRVPKSQCSVLLEDAPTVLEVDRYGADSPPPAEMA